MTALRTGGLNITIVTVYGHCVVILFATLVAYDGSIYIFIVPARQVAV
jgi:hypothetical protein